MKKIWHKVLALLLCVILVCGLMTTASGTSNVYFMAINETVVPMTPENMPIVVGGTLYVPYIMFSLRHNSGVNMGITAQYSTIRRTVMVSQGQNVVIFDPGANTSYDLNGNQLDGRAVLRNSMAYIPLAWVCEYFGTITYTTTRTAYGTLVRVTNELAILNDIDFVDAAAEMLKDNYREYLNSVNSSGWDPSGNNPVESGRPETGPVVYLAFVGAEQADEMAQVLENNNQRGLFFLDVEEMRQQDDLVRRLVGAGHMVGLNVIGGDSASCLSQAEEGSRLLAAVARCQLTILRAADGEEALKRRLEERGYALWESTLTVEDMFSVIALINRLDSGAANYVEVPCAEGSLALMEQAVAELAGTNYRLRQAVAPAL